MSNGNKLNPIEKSSQYYASNPLLQAITAFIPQLGPIRELLRIRAEEIATERAKAFFDELKNSNIELTEEVIRSEEFLHKYVITTKAVTENYQREKIRRLARLFQSSFQQDKDVSIDKYEEYLRIIDDMSDREYTLLCLLEQYEKKHPISESKPEDDTIEDPQEYREAERSRQFWSEFLSDASKTLGTYQAQVEDILSAMQRTGCYKSLGFISFTNMTHNYGKLTSTWFDVRELIQQESRK
jgi:hypothetical protein